MGTGGRSRNFRLQMHFPSILARREVAHPNFRGRPSEASWATQAPDRAELPFFLCNPSGKMTRKIWPANSGLALSGSLNVRAWLAHNFFFSGGGLAADFGANQSSRRQGRGRARQNGVRRNGVRRNKSETSERRHPFLHLISAELFGNLPYIYIYMSNFK